MILRDQLGPAFQKAIRNDPTVATCCGLGFDWTEVVGALYLDKLALIRQLEERPPVHVIQVPAGQVVYLPATATPPPDQTAE